MEDKVGVDADRVLRGKVPGRTSGAPKRADAGRTCGRHGCTTVLSVYNAGARCWQHTPTAPYFLHVGRIRPAG